MIGAAKRAVNDEANENSRSLRKLVGAEVVAVDLTRRAG